MLFLASFARAQQLAMLYASGVALILFTARCTPDEDPNGDDGNIGKDGSWEVSDAAADDAGDLEAAISADADSAAATLEDAEVFDAEQPIDAELSDTGTSDSELDSLPPDGNTLSPDCEASVPDDDIPVDHADDYACGKRDSSPGTLLELGHSQYMVLDVDIAGDRVTTSDRGGHWVLWDLETRRQLLSGEAGADFPNPEEGSTWTRGTATLSGSTLVILRHGGDVEVRDASDGRLLRTFSTGAQPGGVRRQFSKPGSYVWTQSNDGLRAWSLTGELLLERLGPYATAQVFAAAGELLVGQGPAGQQIIERVPLTGPVTTSAFVGTFATWFVDGSKFLSVLDTSLRIYSPAGVQERVLTLAAAQPFAVGGYGEYVWEAHSQAPLELRFRRIDSGETVATFPTPRSSGPVPTATGIVAMITGEDLTIHLVDLRGSRAAVPISSSLDTLPTLSRPIRGDAGRSRAMTTWSTPPAAWTPHARSPSVAAVSSA